MGRLGYRGRELGLVGVRGARVIWAVLWGGFALLWLPPANDSPGSVHDALAGAPTGTEWLTGIVRDVARATAGAGTPIAIALAVLSAGIAIGVYRGRATR